MTDAALLLAVQNADVMRHLAEDRTDEQNKATAEALNRDPSNLLKTIKALRAAGLVEADRKLLTDEGRDLLPGLDVLAGRALAPDAAPSSPAVAWAQIAPSTLNPRTDWDSDEARRDLESLADSIELYGLLQPIRVIPTVRHATADLQFHEIVDGERRWRAIGHLVEHGRWPKDRAVPVILATIGEHAPVEHRRAALIANSQRRDLNPVEEAEAYQALLHDGVSTDEIARDANRSQRHVQQRLQLLKLDKDTQAQVRTGEMGVKDALDLVKVKQPAPEADPQQSPSGEEGAPGADNASAPSEPREQSPYALPNSNGVFPDHERLTCPTKAGHEPLATIHLADAGPGTWYVSTSYATTTGGGGGYPSASGAAYTERAYAIEVAARRHWRREGWTPTQQYAVRRWLAELAHIEGFSVGAFAESDPDPLAVADEGPQRDFVHTGAAQASAARQAGFSAGGALEQKTLVSPAAFADAMTPAQRLLLGEIAWVWRHHGRMVAGPAGNLVRATPAAGADSHPATLNLIHGARLPAKALAHWYTTGEGPLLTFTEDGRQALRFFAASLGNLDHPAIGAQSDLDDLRAAAGATADVRALMADRNQVAAPWLNAVLQQAASASAQTVEGPDLARILFDALVAVSAVRPANWDDDDDPEQAAAWRKAEDAFDVAYNLEGWDLPIAAAETA